MTNRHKNKCLISLINQEMNAQTMKKYDLSSVRKAHSKHIRTKVKVQIKDQSPHSILVLILIDLGSTQNSMVASPKRTSYDRAIRALIFYSKNTE